MNSADLLRLQVEQVADQPARGLRVGDQIGAGGDRASADGHRLGGAPHLDALGRQVAGQPLGPGRIVPGHQHVLARRGLLSLDHGAAPVLQEVAHQALAVAGGGDRGGDRRVEVVHHAVAVGHHGAVVAGERQRPRRRLLVGHADRAVEHRPAVAVAGVEAVVDLADVVGPAALVEAGGVGPAEQVEAGDLALGVVRVQRVGRRGEVVGVVAALLVQVDVHLREVLEGDLMRPRVSGWVWANQSRFMSNR